MTNVAEMSLAEQVAMLSPRKRKSILDKYDPIELKHDWQFWARPKQLAPTIEQWITWVVMAGRGFGKTRIGAEWTRGKAEAHPGCRIALVGRTTADVRDTMIEGESGLLAIHHPKRRPVYEPSKRRVIWPNGSRAIAYSADEPDLLRGPQHHFGWGDEIAAWRYFLAALSNLQFGMRLGAFPQMCFTTTPRPIPEMRDLINDPDTIVTRGSMYDNLPNLPISFVNDIKKKYEGTRLGRQEIGGELIEDIEGALWTRALIDKNRIRSKAEAPVEFVKFAVAIDPSVTSGEDSDECGIVAGGLADNGHAYIFEDLSGLLHHTEWSQRAVNVLHAYKGDMIVAERNNGGDLVEATIRAYDPNAPYTSVWASRGKRTRAEPISLKYEQGKVHHVGAFPEMEDEMCEWVPGSYQSSPNRLDALVWLVTWLYEAEGEAEPMVY